MNINYDQDCEGIVTFEYHVVYSPSYSVPVLYFSAWMQGISHHVCQMRRQCQGNIHALANTMNSLHLPYYFGRRLKKVTIKANYSR